MCVSNKQKQLCLLAMALLATGLAMPTLAAINTASTTGQQPVTWASLGDYGWTVKGRVRAGYVHTQFKQLLPTKDTYSLGAAFDVGTPEWNGLSVAVAAYTAQPVGLNSDDAARNDVQTPARSVNVIGKAYLQYRMAGLKLRAGRLDLDTPLANSVDRRMIPAFYSGGDARLGDSGEGSIATC